MKLTLNWLADFVDLPTDDAAEISAAFESLGFEVEEMRVLALDFAGVVIGRVVEVGPHPNADKIRLCVVDTGGETSEIVCGAWNFEAGAVVPVALPGAVLPGGFEIGRRKIRGVVSNGMICSEIELGLGDDAEGIMVLDGDYPDAADRIGDDFKSILPAADAFFDLEVNPNRPDAMSVLGLARELAAYYAIPVKEPRIELAGSGAGTSVDVEILDAEACPRFVAREVRNVTIGPSPRWMRARLLAVGQRPINNVVDASNYAMLELGHPTHAFDADRLGNQIVVRRAAPGERLVTLDEVDRELLETDIVVADVATPVALAGVMGGRDTEVHDDTTRVIIEAAYWNPPSVLLTSKRLGLRSEASARFERGADPNFCAVAADRVAELLAEIAGGSVASDREDAYPAPVEEATVLLPLEEVPRVLGVDVPAEESAHYLTRLGFSVSGSDPLVVAVPTRRPDVARPVDLIEEIGRLYGYDNIPDTVATGTGGGLPDPERRLRKLRGLLAGAGYHETLLFSFIGASDLDALRLVEADPRREGVRVVNPLRDEEGVMRTTLLPGLLKALATNQARYQEAVSLFEIGKVFLPGAGKLPEQPEHLGFVSVGTRGRDWENPGRAVDIRDAVGLWELITQELRLPAPEVTAVTNHPFHPGRAAEASLGGVPVGVIGEIHPRVTESFGISGRVAAGEIELAPLVAYREDWLFAPPSPYPPAVFDLAFETDVNTPAGDILGAVRRAGGEVIEELEIFDLFAGEPLPEGRKSVAIHITMRHPQRTLTDDEVKPLRRSIVAEVETATDSSLRGEL